MFEIRDRVGGTVVLALRARDVRTIGRGTAMMVPVDSNGNRLPTGTIVVGGSDIEMIPRSRVNYAAGSGEGVVQTEESIEALVARHEEALIEEQAEIFFSDEEADDIVDALAFKRAVGMAAVPPGALETPLEPPAPSVPSDDALLERALEVVEARIPYGSRADSLDRPGLEYCVNELYRRLAMERKRQAHGEDLADAMVGIPKALEDLRGCQANKDLEVGHIEADRVLCRVLRALGHGEIVDEWVKVRRVYS